MAKGRGAKEIEMEHMTDKMMEDPVSKGIENTNGDLNTNEQSEVMKAETEMQKGDEAVEQSEPSVLLYNRTRLQLGKWMWMY